MIPGTYDLCLYKGDTGRWQFRLWTDEAKTQAADLTGATAKAQIRPGHSGSATNMTCTITTPNIIDMALPAGSSPPARGLWDLEITYASGDVQTVLAGKVTTQGDVTSNA
jgi:hypothetical protein